MTYQVLQGDCVSLMATMPAASVDAVVCDPPYGLGFMGKDWDTIRAEASRPESAENPAEGTAEARGAYPRTGKGPEAVAFDRSAFQAWCQAWATEALRVLKPGGHLLAFGGTRTYHRLVCAVEDAGFEIRDTISWLYGSGFPKSLNVGAAIDRAAGAEREVVGVKHADRYPNGPGGVGFHGGPGEYSQVGRPPEPQTAPATPEAERWEGWGTALKPAMEPVVVARKPLSGTVAANCLKHGTGALNVDGCRVGTDDDLAGGGSGSGAAGAYLYGGFPTLEALREAAERDEWCPDARKGSARAVLAYAESLNNERLSAQRGGRWPANVVLSHTEGCVQVGTRKVKSQSPSVPQPKFDSEQPGVSLDFKAGVGRNGEMSAGYSAPDGTETVGAWSCTPDCPVRLLDEQTGELAPQGSVKKKTTTNVNCYSDMDCKQDDSSFYGDQGGASRFYFCAKSSRRERNAGLEGFEEQPPSDQDKWSVKDRRSGTARNPEEWTATTRNHHPTVKPISLMRWLVRLVTPPNGVVLDPFAGSGTTGCAAVLEGFDFIGLEREPEYVKIAEARIVWWHKHRGDGEAADILAAGELRDSVEATGQLGMFD